MKKLYTMAAFLVGIWAFAQQEAGKTGELLKNEATQKEMQLQRKDITPTTNSRNTTNPKSTDTFGSRNPSNNNNRNDHWTVQHPTSDSRNAPRYNWNQNFGYAEVFLRIPEYGYFTVEIGDQVISSTTGKFRFFDLSSGRIPIAIYENGYLLYRTQVNIRNNTRLVLDYFDNYGLYLLDSYAVKGQMYGFDQWDDVWNNPYNNGNRDPYAGGHPNPGTPYNNKAMDNHTFENFLQNMKKTAKFDKDKVGFINQQLTVSYFTAVQIKELLKTFSFDDQRLLAAKKLYTRCTDVANFYIVYDSFDFDKNKKELMLYVSNQRS